MTADDLGLSAGVTRGILEAHRQGVVRSTSLLVTFPAAQEAAALALAERDLEIGLHLDLVGGEPASDPAAVPSLCDEDGRFYPLASFARRLFTGRVRAGGARGGAARTNGSGALVGRAGAGVGFTPARASPAAGGGRRGTRRA